MTSKKPELLCPAGSPDALDAAIEGGADAVYFGGAQFNARMNAKNFGGDALRSAVLSAHRFGVKTYLTLNTLVTDRELPDFVEAAHDAANAGVDALIIADLGGAAAIHRAMPSLELHASTQMSGHNAAMGTLLASLGYKRMVAARESSLSDLAAMVRNAPIEIEMFVHGALCVSHSGQCLFSSIVGGRSGNRGECAQPCRLPYSCDGCKHCKEEYPLSLKDLSLACHIPEILSLGVASLKIEGRMKSPEYVRDTARIWRRLLDEERKATPDEMRMLSETFSRNGFTDGYYTEKIGHTMLGVRSDTDKAKTKAIEPFSGLTKKIALDASFLFRKDTPTSLTLSDGIRSVTVLGDAPLDAIHAAMDEEMLRKNLTKLGGTPYCFSSLSIISDEGLMIPVSRLNDLRRRAIAAWEEAESASPISYQPPIPAKPVGKRGNGNSASFCFAKQITESAKSYFEKRFLPLFSYHPSANGVILPPVIFDRDTESVGTALKAAKDAGAVYALVGNLGHLAFACECGLLPIGDFRLNATNRESVKALEDLGIRELILSPELTLPQIRDIGGNTRPVIYGRIPLMTLEKCVIREIADCTRCSENQVALKDRRGARFPVLREWEHRNVIYNSLPTSMSDRKDLLEQNKIPSGHFLFSVESAKEVDFVIRSFENGTPIGSDVRRIK